MKLRARFIVGFCAIAAVSTVWGATAHAANWIEDYAEALEDARQAQRPLLIVFEDPSQSTFRVTKISLAAESDAEAVLNRFTLCRIDVSESLGKQVAELFRASEIPYVAITDKQARRIVYRRAGSVSNLDWATTLARYNGEHSVRYVSEPVEVRETRNYSRSSRGRCFS